MEKREARRPPRKLTRREAFWIENFHAHETPASLRLADDFVNFLKPNDKVLEVGCAFGRVANYLSIKRDVFVTGIDINAKEIIFAQEFTSRINSKTGFQVMDGVQLEFPNDVFDDVVMVGVLGGVGPEERKSLLEEAFRVVKPGGRVAISEFAINTADPEKKKKYEIDESETGEWGSKVIRKGGKILFIAKHFTEDELRILLSDAGFGNMDSREQAVETAGIGDGIVEARRQYTVWGTKPAVE